VVKNILVVSRFTSEDRILSEKARAIRHKVFVVEQGVDPVLEYEYEDEAHHYLLCMGRKAVATARWREVNGAIKLERFAVLSNFRDRGFGKVILLEVLIDTLPLMKPIYLHSQVKAIRFYERNGFVKEGEKFNEAGIEHYNMRYEG
jgi:predicted GNAT family N-acyltransferase